MKEYRFTAEPVLFQDQDGYMVRQYDGSEVVAANFVPEYVYEEFCTEVGIEPEIASH